MHWSCQESNSVPSADERWQSGAKRTLYHMSYSPDIVPQCELLLPTWRSPSEMPPKKIGSSLAATLNKELDECRWVIPQARVRTPAGTLAGTLPHGTFVAASGRRTAARQTGMALARRSLPGMPSAARFSSLWTAGRVSGFGPSTLMCPIPVTHTHTHNRRWPRR